jgi:hypothetical protein
MEGNQEKQGKEHLSFEGLLFKSKGIELMIQRAELLEKMEKQKIWRIK